MDPLISRCRNQAVNGEQIYLYPCQPCWISESSSNLRIINDKSRKEMGAPHFLSTNQELLDRKDIHISKDLKDIYSILHEN